MQIPFEELGFFKQAKFGKFLYKLKRLYKNLRKKTDFYTFSSILVFLFFLNKIIVPCLHLYFSLRNNNTSKIK